ncbi:MAG TPA: protein-disulfide reductase DsbD domain-containing protein [Thermoanaerobaculia bacterium]|jgi:DsbC/DsbD-like thiol-disulfide interchange protein|nr:protein-disulfide reductase DsbD domain-containing protein [Thermoanaerobaculia bacterium]
MNPSKSTLLCAAIAAALLVPSPARPAASQWSVNPQSRVRLISPWQIASRDGELILGLHFRLAPGWHVYWKNSGDAGFPPSVTFQPAEILGKPELLWPTPHRFDLPGGLVAFGYADEVVYPVRATIWPDALPSPGSPRKDDPAAEDPSTARNALTGGDAVFIKADLDYLVCEVDCIPYRYTLTLEQPLGEPAVTDPDTAPLLQSWLDRLPRTAAEVPGLQIGTLLDAARPGEPDLEIRLRGVTAKPGETDLFLESHESLDAGRPRVKVLQDAVIFHVPLKPREAGNPLPSKVAFAWTVSNLSRGDERFSLATRREVEVVTGSAAKPGRTPAGAPDRLSRLLLWALLGGALLNLSPTVLALLAGEVLALRQGGSGARERAAAAATGIVGGCWMLAALALAARRAGYSVGWGIQLQEPAMGALLAVASALLALNLWGLVEIPLAASSSRSGTGRHLLAGLFTVPLALAWPVPMLDEPLGYAFSRGPAAVCAVFAVVGFGLALPYVILAAVPAAVRLSSAAPAWLPRLREGLGFLAGASVFWVLRVLSRQVRPEGLAWIELCLIGMALLAWLRAREASGKALRFALALGLAACAAGASWLADDNRLAPRPAAASRSHRSTDRLPSISREPPANRTSGG